MLLVCYQVTCIHHTLAEHNNHNTTGHPEIDQRAFEVHIFTRLDFHSISHVTILLFFCNLKTNNCRYMKISLNVFIFSIYTP